MEQKKHICATCGREISEESGGSYVVNPGMDKEFTQCWLCHVADSDNGVIISCEACGAWFSTGVLHDEIVAGQSFCACPSCSRDIVEGMTREEMTEQYG